MVPALGESITEGSISKWERAVGDKVAADDVIVVVETDKVTVDIKANHSGVITQLLAVETVIVGHPLYEIDTEGTSASVSTNNASAATFSIAPETVAEGHEGSRKPLIKFIGKRTHVKVQLDQKHEAPKTAPKAILSQTVSATSLRTPSKPQTGVDFTKLKGGAFFGRPKLSAKEMDAIQSGGADILL